MFVSCNALHRVPSPITLNSTEATRPVAVVRFTNKRARDGVRAISKSSNRKETVTHFPLVSHWYTPDPTSETGTANAIFTVKSDQLSSSATQRKLRKQEARFNTRRRESRPVNSHRSLSSKTATGLFRKHNIRADEAALVFNKSNTYQSTSATRLPDQNRANKDASGSAPIPPFHSPSLDEGNLNTASWHPWNLEMDKEISQFVIYLLGRYTISISPLQIYSIIFEWERYRHQKQLALQHQWTLRMRQQKRRQHQLKEYNRHLRYFASILTQQHMNQLRKARTFREFKQIMFERPSTDSETDHVVAKPAALPPSSLIGPPLRYPVPGQNIVAASSSALQFPGGSGGGIYVESLRSNRKGSTRESRAIIEHPTEEDTKPSVTVGNKFNRMGQSKPSVGQENTQATKTSDSAHRVSSEDEDEEPSYSEAELRSAFESYQEFRRTACQPQKKTLCVRSLLNLQQEHTTVVIPRGFHVRRCGSQIQPVCNYHASTWRTEVDGEESDLDAMSGDSSTDSGDGAVKSRISGTEWFSHPPSVWNNEAEHLEFAMERNRYTACECETAEEECLPTNVTLRTQAVAVSRILPLQNLKHSTELIVVTEHTSCGCQPRCRNRLCVSPLTLVVHTISDCACICPPNDHRCHQLLEGIDQFSPDEIPLPLNGSFILPPCRYGPMDDVHLYHRRCPRPIRRPMSRT